MVSDTDGAGFGAATFGAELFVGGQVTPP